MVSRRRSAALVALLLSLVLVVAACGGDGGGDGGGVGDDLLAQILEEGVLTVSTDPAYPPQSFLNEEEGTYEGFDIHVAAEIASRLGVEIAWEAPAWDTIIAGGWNDRWDVSVGSMTITPERAEVLHFTPPYYFTPASVAVHVDNTTIAEPVDTSGQRVGVCGGCTYDLYLQGTLEIAEDPSGEPVAIESVVADPEIVTYDTDSTAIQDLARRRSAPERGDLGPADARGGDQGRLADQGRRPAGLLRAAVGGDRPELAAHRRASSISAIVPGGAGGTPASSGPIALSPRDPASSACATASRTGSSSIRSSTSWKKPRTISRSASPRGRPRAISRRARHGRPGRASRRACSARRWPGSRGRGSSPRERARREDQVAVLLVGVRPLRVRSTRIIPRQTAVAESRSAPLKAKSDVVFGATCSWNVS